MNLIIMQNHGTSLHQTLKSYSYANAGVPRTKVEKKDDIKCIQIYKLYVQVRLLKTAFFQNTNFKWKKKIIEKEHLIFQNSTILWLLCLAQSFEGRKVNNIYRTSHILLIFSSVPRRNPLLLCF